MDERDRKKLQLEDTLESATLAIKNQLGDYKDKSKNLLIIGGIVVAAYAFSKIFMDDDDEENNEEKARQKDSPSFISTAMSGMVTSVLLTLAKNKIMELLEQLNKDSDGTEENN